MLARQSSVIAAFKDGLNILLIQAGQNDLLSTDAPLWLTAFSAYLAKFKEAIESSGKLVRLGICTHNPRNDNTFNANRAVADPALRLFPSEGKCDFIVDWAVDATWGPDPAAANQTLYPDGTHPSQAGQSNMEAKYFRPVLNSLSFQLT
jgi:lysophospholipase L1-like esterase